MDLMMHTVWGVGGGVQHKAVFFVSNIFHLSHASRSRVATVGWMIHQSVKTEIFKQLLDRGGKSAQIKVQILVLKKRLVKVRVLTQLLHSSQSNKVQVVKCTQSIKVKSFPLKDISVQS